MANTYTFLLAHCVFSTRNREPAITADIRERLWAYLGGIARENGMKALAIGGTRDHAHVLLSFPATMPVSKAVQLLKGGSSKWVHDAFPPRCSFAWQAGYGAFTVGLSQVPAVVEYVRTQADHHRRRTFQEEYLAFLREHNVAYDERYVWG